MKKKELSVTDFLANLKSDATEEQRKMLENIYRPIVDKMNEMLDQIVNGTADKDEIAAEFKSMTEKLSGIGAMTKQIEDLQNQVKAAAETIEKMKKNGVSADFISKFDEQLNAMFDSEKFIDFAEGRRSKSGKFEFDKKGVTNLENNYTGNILLNQQQKRVVDPFANGKVHLRDVINVEQGDPEYPSLTFNQISSLDRNVRYVTENGQLPESAFSVKEVTEPVKRLGTTLFISKRMLKSRTWVRSYILAHLPQWIQMAEDWNIMFGDGQGENFTGIVNNTNVKSIESILGDNVVTGAAGSIEAISGYNSNADTIIEFKTAQPLIRTGMQITFTGAAVITALNSAKSIIKMNDRQILLKGVAYSGTETAIATVTWVVKNKYFQNIVDPNSEDAIRTAFALMSYGEFTPNLVVLNPSDVNAIECEKDTTGRSLGLVQTIGGQKYIAGRLVVESSQIPEGKYLIGDFINGASLVDYTALTLEWAEDVDTKRKNQVALIAQEECIFALYNPFAFAYGDIAALITAITKP